MADFPHILRAAADGNVPRLKELLKDIPPDTSNAIGQAPIHLAAMWGHREAVALLLEAGANVNLANDFGVTPLHYAAQKGVVDVAKLLIANGADKRARAKSGLAPWESAEDDEMRALCGAPTLELHRAVKRYDADKLRALVVDGSPDLAEVDGEGRTALHLAIMAGPHETGLVDALLAAGDDPAKAPNLAQAMVTRSREGLTPFHLAARMCSVGVMEALLGKLGERIVVGVLEMRTHLAGKMYSGQWGKKDADGELVELDNEHMTALHLVLEALEPDEDDDDDDDDGTGDGDDPADHAPGGVDREEATRLVALLIERGADVNALDVDGRAPIHQAVGCGLHEIAKVLLDAGADPTFGCKAIGVDNNPLHQATLRGDGRMIALLLRAKADAKDAGSDAPVAQLDVDAGGQNGFTPLALAARSANMVAARALLEGGADPNAVMSNGKSALDIAKLNKRTALIELFRGAGAVDVA